jgi:molybdopterin-guanine dinucleotide biosynthesis protein A
VLWAREKPLYAGPLAAVGAGFLALGPVDDAAVVVVVAADMPRAGRAVAALAEAARAAGAAVVVDPTGRPQPLLSAFTGQWLRRRLDELTPWAGKPARLLVEPPGRQVPDLWQAADDIDLAEQLPPDILADDAGQAT